MPGMPSIVLRSLTGWGTTYGPPGDGPFPAVLLLHGSEGGWSGWSHRNAAILAAHGFLCFPLNYSRGGNMWNAGSIRDVPLDETVDAIKALRSFAPCTGKLGVYGISRGGEHALLVTSLMAAENDSAQPDAVAAHSPADVVCGAFDAKIWRDKGDPGSQVWDPAQRAWTWRGESDDLKPSTPIEIERYEGPLFISHGTEDTVWSVEMTRRLEQRLRDHDRQPEIHYYEGEGHGWSADAENRHHDLLIAFFTRHLAG